jgi:hypothetical protein
MTACAGPVIDDLESLPAGIHNSTKSTSKVTSINIKLARLRPEKDCVGYRFAQCPKDAQFSSDHVKF